MRTGIKETNRKSDNRGISLVELIVVISIMAVMVGIVSISLSIMFTRDADYVAMRIDDELSEARMLSMSRAGDFTYVLNIKGTDRKGSEVIIYNAATQYKEPVKLNKSVTIELTGSGIPTPAESGDVAVAIVFDKAKGSVSKVGEYGGTMSDATGVYTITVKSTRNESKKNVVTLVATTGRHYTEK